MLTNLAAKIVEKMAFGLPLYDAKNYFARKDNAI